MCIQGLPAGGLLNARASRGSTFEFQGFPRKPFGVPGLPAEAFSTSRASHGSTFKPQISKFGPQTFNFEPQNSNFGIQTFKFGPRIPKPSRELWISNIGFWNQMSNFGLSGTFDLKPSILDLKSRSLDLKPSSLNLKSRSLALDFGIKLRTLGFLEI